MSCSLAQLTLDRANDPRLSRSSTPEGQAASRRNSLRHDFTGQGAVIPGEDAAELARRSAAIQTELRVVGSPAAALLAERIAALTVRIERSVRYDLAMTAGRVREAVARFDEARRVEAERLQDGIEADPTGTVRRLLALPEGVDLVVNELEALRRVARLDATGGWTTDHANRFKLYASVQSAVAGWPGAGSLIREQRTGDRAESPGRGALGSIVGWLDAAIRRLQEHRVTLDFASIAAARSAAADRVLVDASPESLLARKYEASSERSMLRLLRELRELRVTAPEPSTVATALPPTVSPEPADRVTATSRSLGSFLPTSLWETGPAVGSTTTTEQPPDRPRSRYEDRKRRPKLPR